MPHSKHITDEMRHSIDNCLHCYNICEETINHCLRMGGRHADPEHLILLRDCAEICRTTAGFLLRGSEFHAQNCGVCTVICSQCAEACEHTAEGDQTMQLCADICRQCADSCAALAGARVQ